MGTKVVVFTACKIFGLYLLVLAAMNLRDIIYWILLATTESAFGDRNPLTALLPVYMLLTNAGVGLLLTFKADIIVEKIVQSDGESLNINMRRTDLIELTIISIGILSILSAIPEILIRLVDYAYLNRHDYEEGSKSNYWDDANISNVLYSVFKLVAGIFLLLNARYLGRVFWRVGEKEDARPL